MLPPALRQQLEQELASGETLLWTGQPDAARIARQSWPLVLFGLLWQGFVLYWSWVASGFWLPGSDTPPEPFALFGLPFFLAGVVVLASPRTLARKARRTGYAITDRRALIIERGRRLSVRSFAPEALADLERRERADGSGDIIFTRDRTGSGKGSRALEVGFFGLPAARDVERRLRALAVTRAS